MPNHTTTNQIAVNWTMLSQGKACITRCRQNRADSMDKVNWHTLCLTLFLF